MDDEATERASGAPGALPCPPDAGVDVRILRSVRPGEAEDEYQLFGPRPGPHRAPGSAAQAADGITGSISAAAATWAPPRVVPSEDFSPLIGRERQRRSLNYVFKQDVRGVLRRAKSTLDSGLQVGARVDLRGQTDTTDQIRDVYAYFSGGFGEKSASATPSRPMPRCATWCRAPPPSSAPTAPASASRTPASRHASATNGTCYGIDSNSDEGGLLQPDFRRLPVRRFLHAGQHGSTAIPWTAPPRASQRSRTEFENLSLAGTFSGTSMASIWSSAAAPPTASTRKLRSQQHRHDARSPQAATPRWDLAGSTFGAPPSCATIWRYQRRPVGLRRRRHLQLGRLGRSGSAGPTATTEATGANGVGPFNADHDICYGCRPPTRSGRASRIDGVLEYSDYHSRNTAAGPGLSGRRRRPRDRSRSEQSRGPGRAALALTGKIVLFLPISSKTREIIEATLPLIKSSALTSCPP